MTLTAGAKLGPYEILAPIGKGGMGEVWKARDTRLGRDVAIKISAEQFSERFEREARAVAALNHPNICTLYDVGPNYLVMEYIEGATLAERIKEGPIPLEEALGIARHVADALDAAHEKNIIHRDLKPGNIKIKPDGSVKVLDFGLAKMGGTPAAKPEDSPTLSMAATQAGMILGTAAYMSPEQARGKEVDKRADIWAFGVVLYEMVTGKKLFQGDDITDTLAAVLRHEPNWEQVPAQVRRLLKRCLEKDPKKRLRDIGDVWELLEEAPAIQGAQYRSWLWPSVAALLFISLVPIAFLHFREKSPTTPQSMLFQIIPPEKSPTTAHVSISPDGRQVLYSGSGTDGREHLWLRDLNAPEARLLLGAEGSGTPSLNPFWSPDSRFIGFSVEGKVKKIAVSGGPPQALCDTADGDTGGGAWNQEGVILFGSNASGLFRVSSSGGVATAVTVLDPSRHERFHRRPVFLPDERHFLYVRTSDDPENTGIFVGSLDAKPEEQSRKRLLPSQIGVVYAPAADASTGFILFLQDDTLMAQAFDSRRLELTGEAAPVAEQVGNNTNTTGYFSASDTGALVYLSAGGTNSRLMWFDRQGKALGPASEPGRYLHLKLSPDGTQVAASRRDGKNVDIWLLEFARGTSTRLTFDPERHNFPIWSPDGSQIVFAYSQKGTTDLYRKPSSGAGEEEALLKSNESKYPTDWSGDGRFLLYTVNGPKTRSDIWMLPLDGDHKATPFLATPFMEGHARFSPDGHWVVYQSNESGRTEVYVRSFPSSGGGKWMVSSGGGSMPRWRKDGKELLYFAPDNRLMSVEVSTTGVSFQAGVPKPLFKAPAPVLLGVVIGDNWDVTADGQRFLVNTIEDSNLQPITVVLNWQAGLKK